MSKEKAMQRAFDTCNLIGEEADITAVMFRYKAFREMSDEEFDECYNEIAFRLGFMW